MLGAPQLDKIHRCDREDCKARKLCEIPKGLLPPRNYDPEDCNSFYPVEDLRGENLRDNPKLHRQFQPGTKHHRKRGGKW